MANDQPGPSGPSGDNVFAKGPPPGYLPPEQLHYPPPDGFNAVSVGGIPVHFPSSLFPNPPMPVATPMPMSAPSYYQQGVGYPATAPGFPPSNSNSVPGSVHVVTLPSASAPREWSRGICDCCLPAKDGTDGCSLCCCTFWCSCITFGRIVERAGLAKAAPMAVIYFFATTGLFVSLLVVASKIGKHHDEDDRDEDLEHDHNVVLVQIIALVVLFLSLGFLGGYYRCAIRKKFKFEGNDCNDFVTHACCCCCALCQEYRTMVDNVTKGVWTGGPAHAVPVLIPPVIHQMRT